MNLKDCSNCLKQSTNHTVKILIFLLLFFISSYSQQNTSPNNTNSQNDSVFVMSKSPWGAVLRSAVLPGWGQFYNESYLKIPVIWGLGFWLGYEWKQNNNFYVYYKNQYIKTSNPNDRDYRTIYRDQRDLFTIYMVLVYIANLVDAYVDANLFDFDVSENTLTRTPMLNLKVNF
jgi:Family of unknown function (DUF5683)